MAIKNFIERYGNVIFFIGGFIFDALTMVRIDSFLDIAIQAVYLCGISILLLIQARIDGGRWTPSGRWAKLWHYETELLHFFYGGLLSGYVVFYFKSTSFSRSIFFISLVVFLMVANEMPQIRRAGSLMRLGLYAFCIVSFLNYLFPVLIGTMGWWVFLLAWIASGWICYKMVRAVERISGAHEMSKKLRLAPSLVLLLVLVLYFTKLIPPVPMSVQYVGIYRSVEKVGPKYKLTYRKPPWYKAWQKSERVFQARPNDTINCFVRVFAPSRFEQRVYICWKQLDERRDVWQSSDRIPILIKGGRDQGYRGVTTKSFYAPGRWRVVVETDDGRILSEKDFRIETDERTEPYLTGDVWM